MTNASEVKSIVTEELQYALLGQEERGAGDCGYGGTVKFAVGFRRFV